MKLLRLAVVVAIISVLSSGTLIACKKSGEGQAAAPQPKPEQPAPPAPAPDAAAQPGVTTFSGQIETETYDGFKLFDAGEAIIKKYGEPAKKNEPRFSPEQNIWNFTLDYDKGIKFTLVGDSNDVRQATIMLVEVSGAGLYTGSGAGIGTGLDDLKKMYLKGSAYEDSYMVTNQQDCSPQLVFNLKDGKVVKYEINGFICND